MQHDWWHANLKAVISLAVTWEASALLGLQGYAFQYFPAQQCRIWPCGNWTATNYNWRKSLSTLVEGHVLLEQSTICERHQPASIFVQIKSLETASEARQATDSKTVAKLEGLEEGLKGLREERDVVLETLEGLSAYNKQMGLKELPKRLSLLETQFQSVQQERQQMPSWVKRQTYLVSSFLRAHLHPRIIP